MRAILGTGFGNGIGERDLGTGFGNGDEVTEPVEVPRSDFEKRDGNIASKDIAESPTASPERPKKTKDKRLRTKVFLVVVFRK